MVTLVGLSLVFLTAGCGQPGSHHQEPGVAPAGTVRERPNTVDRALRHAFRILRTRRRAVDELPSGLALEARRLGMNPMSARLAHGWGIARMYVVAGGAQMCVVDSRQVLTDCWSKADALHGAAGMAAICAPNLAPRTIQLAGLVPDGVTSVTIAVPRARKVTAYPSLNVWTAVLPARNPLPLTAVWRRHGRTERHATGIPPGIRAGQCAGER